jgi:hypothetical protein
MLTGNPAPVSLGTTKKSGEIIILPQPVCLRGQVPVEDIAFLILETPRDHDEDVAFADPCPLLDLALDPAHPLNAIVAADADMVCAHHQFSAGELLAKFLLGQPHTDYRCTIGVETPRTIALSRFFAMIVN